MKAFLATVLSVIAVGVLLVAYGLLAPRTSAGAMELANQPYGLSQPVAQRVMLGPDGVYRAYPIDAGAPLAQPATLNYPVAYPAPATAPRAAYASTPARRVPARTVERRGRDWTKTAMVIGGSTAAGAGIGAIVGGKKGALIGAALGGGASTIYEVKH